MSIDASSTKYFSGRGGVVIVDDPIETVEEVARAYDVRWLVLDKSDSVPSVAPVIDGTVRPAWIGPVGLEFHDGISPAVGDDPAGGLYPVCFDPGDTRCAR
jgi:hypothetical protein